MSNVDLLINLLGISDEDIVLDEELDVIHITDDTYDLENTKEAVVKFIAQRIKDKEKWAYERGQENIRIGLKQLLGLDYNSFL